MKTFKNIRLAALLSLSLLLCPVGAGEVDLEARLTSMAEILLPEEESRVALMREAVYSGKEAVAVTSENGISQVIFLERFPAALPEQDRREFVELQGMHALMKHQALRAVTVRDAFGKFAYTDILLEYAGGKLIHQVKAQVEMDQVTLDYAAAGQDVAVLIRAPEHLVQLETVRLVSSEDAGRYYLVAILERAKAAIAKQDYENAANLLLEARKQGHDTKELFMDLYVCFAGTGGKESASRLTEYLLRTKSGELTLDDCIELARVAKKASMKQQSDQWFREAESRVRIGLRFDMLIPGVPL